GAAGGGTADAPARGDRGAGSAPAAARRLAAPAARARAAPEHARGPAGAGPFDGSGAAGRLHRNARGARYIMPPMSGMPPPAPPLSFTGASATIATVVRMFFAIEAA